jgi:type IV pilus assembly protein PilO
MGFSFKESPWYIQALVFVALAILLLAAGEYVPGLPVAKARTELQALHSQDTQLNQEVSALQVYERRYAEFQQEMTALNKQLDTLQAIVPEEKQTDEFLLLLQGSAAASGVQIRKLTAMPVVSADYHYNMPFGITVDGPYYSIVDFFSRLSRLSRIINVGDMTFSGLGGGKSAGGYPMKANTTVSGSCIVTTFFTNPSTAPANASAKPAAKPAATPAQKLG